MRKNSLIMAVLLGGCSSGGPGGGRSEDAASAGGTTTIATGGQGGEAAGSGGQSGGGGAVSTGGIVPSGGTSTTGGDSGTGGKSTTGGATGRGGGSGGMAGAGGTDGEADAGSDARGGDAADLKPDVPTPDTAEARPDRPPADLGPLGNVTVYIAGDSTVSTYTNSAIHQAGWGQFLQGYFDGKATIVNKAVGGMTARHFIEAGYLDDIISSIKAGDYLLVQFGTNDGNKTATYTLPGSTAEIPYYLDPQTDFKTYLAKYVDATRAKNATTIFVTPPPRHSCSAGQTGVSNGLATYATAMKELGPTLSTPVVDLNAMTVAYLATVACETSGSTFYLVKADGAVDSTHFQENGANIMAGLVAKGSSGVRTLAVPLAAYVK